MKKKILLVEHNPDTIDIITEILYQAIFDITVAGNAEAAKKLLEKHEFHMVITEALLPKSHGFVLAKYISEHYPETKVIIISEKIKKMDYKHDALQHGACEFIEKPLDVIKFKKKIQKHLNIKDKDENDKYHAETTNIHVIPLLDDLKSDKEEKPAKDDFDDLLKNIKDKEDKDSFKIELD